MLLQFVIVYLIVSIGIGVAVAQWPHWKLFLH